MLPEKNQMVSNHLLLLHHCQEKGMTLKVRTCFATKSLHHFPYITMIVNFTFLSSIFKSNLNSKFDLKNYFHFDIYPPHIFSSSCYASWALKVFNCNHFYSDRKWLQICNIFLNVLVNLSSLSAQIYTLLNNTSQPFLTSSHVLIIYSFSHRVHRFFR